MSQLFANNKELIHICAEVVVVLGLAYWMNQKNKTLLTHIEELAHRLEEHEDKLEKHDKQLQAIMNQVGALTNAVMPSPPVYAQTRSQGEPMNRPRARAPERKQTVHRPPPPPVIHEVPEEELEEYETESHLDRELAEELGDLKAEEDYANAQ